LGSTVLAAAALQSPRADIPDQGSRGAARGQLWHHAPLGWGWPDRADHRRVRAAGRGRGRAGQVRPRARRAGRVPRWRDGDHPVAAEPVRRPGHPGGPRHGDGPGGDPGRAAPVRLAAQPGGGRWAWPGAGDAGRGRRQVDERIRGSPQEPLTLRSENRT